MKMTLRGLWAAAALLVPSIALAQATTGDPTSVFYPINASRAVVQGVPGTAANGTTDDSAALAAACVSGTGIRLQPGATYYIANSVTLACTVHAEGTVSLPPAKFSIASGKVLSFTGKLDAAPVDIFTGPGTESMGPMNPELPVEWFGAVGDFVPGSGTYTNNAPALQEALNALYAGHIVLGPKYYATSVPLAINRGGIGIRGQAAGYTYPSASPVSVIVNTSASNDTLDIQGTNTNYLVWNDFRDFALQRSVLPSGNAAGFAVSFSGGLTADRIYSEDSIRDFYLNGAPSDGIGSFKNCSAGWGYSMVSGYTASQTLYGWQLDSSNGAAENTLILSNDAVGNGAGLTPTSYGFYIAGNAINDVDMELPNTAGTTYGLYVSKTSGGTDFSSGDILIHKGTFDAFGAVGIYVTGLTNATMGSIILSDVYSVSEVSSATAALQVVNSSGVTATNGQLRAQNGAGVILSGATNIKLLGNRIFHSSVGINADSASTGLVSHGNFINSDVTTPFVGSALDLSTQNYGNSSYGFLSNAGVPVGWGSVVGAQGMYAFDQYYNGSNWIAPKAGGPAALRLGDLTTSDYNGTAVGLSLHVAPPATAGATISTEDTTASAFLLFPGLTNSGAAINHALLNRNSDSPMTAGTDFGKDTAFQVNVPTTADNASSAMFVPTAVADKAATVQALPGQTGAVFAAQDSSGVPHFVLDSGANVNGPATAPTGTCSVAGSWVFSQDGHATFCPSANGTWTTKI